MESSLETGYQPLYSYHENGEDTPQETNVMIHLVPESNKARWNHIEDLDSFFTRVYQYHQKHGFLCMMTQEILELIQFVFIVLLTTFVMHCIDFPVLFRDKIIDPTTKTTIFDVIIPCRQCISSFSATVIMCLIVAFVFWVLRVVKVVYHFFQFMEIKAFYGTALKISESELVNMTWHEVQERMRFVQREQQMCIHKQELTELDIYHRILRFKNYMIAMVNKSLLPLKFTLPMIGEYVFLSKGLKYNLELLLFWGPWAPFENNWHLKEDYKKVHMRKELAQMLSKRILWIGIANFVLCPLVLLWQILYSFFNYAEVIKREPGSLGARRWSLYGKLYLRHFNELDHELNARLNRGYRPATKYMSIFNSHFMTIISKTIAFFCGSVLAILILLTLYDEDVLQVEHVLPTMTVLGLVIAFCGVFIPDEHLVWCPEKLMTSILAYIHYVPDHWRGNAHTTKVRNEFAHVFQYKAMYLLEEVLSPIITPLILCFCLRHKALDVVDFYRNFTVDVVGVGDVCSFAQMDVRKHGNPQWMAEGQTQASQYQQAEDGKTELSLMHFKLTNPHWNPPEESTMFLKQLKQHATADANMMHYMQDQNPFYMSLNSMSSLGAGYVSIINNMMTRNLDQSMEKSCKRPSVRGGTFQMEGPPLRSLTDGGLLASFHSAGEPSIMTGTSSCQPSAHFSGGDASANVKYDDPHIELAAAEMSFNALYMHELHHRQLHPHSNAAAQLLWQRVPSSGVTSEMPDIQEEEERAETTPLLTR